MQTKHLFQIIESPTGQALRRLRGPYSQRELALALAVTEDTVVKWEAGSYGPTPTNVRKLLIHAKDWTRRLGLTLTDLLTDLDPPTERS